MNIAPPSIAIFAMVVLLTACNDEAVPDKLATPTATPLPIVTAQSIPQISTADAMQLAMKQFDAYLPTIEADHDAIIDLKEPHAGDFTGDGLDDIAVYFSLTPKGGGNALIGQGLALYKNTGTGTKVIAGFEPDYLFTFNRISGGRIYVDKLEYAEDDGRCCPSIREEKALTISGNKVH